MKQDITSASPSYERELRFIVQMNGVSEKLALAAKSVLGTGIETEPLFPGATREDSTADMQDFFVVRKQGVSFRAATLHSQKSFNLRDWVCNVIGRAPGVASDALTR